MEDNKVMGIERVVELDNRISEMESDKNRYEEAKEKAVQLFSHDISDIIN